MITEDIKIRGKFQFELKIGCLLPGERKKSSYEIETYYFFPTSLGIDKENYRRQNFFSDIQTYIRFMAPNLTLDEILNSERSPLKNIKRSINELAKKSNFLNIKLLTLQR